MKKIYLFTVVLSLFTTSCKKYNCRVCADGEIARDQFRADPCGDGSNLYKIFTAGAGSDPYKNNMYCTPE